MKRLLVPLLLVVFLFLASCAPAPIDSNLNNPNNQPDNTTNTPSLTPAYIVKTGGGSVILYIYEFDNRAGQHCTIVADALITTMGYDTDSSPALDCD